MVRRIGEQARRVAAWVVGLVRDVIGEWGKDRVGGLAAEIAFFALLGIFPTLTVLASLLGSMGDVLGDDVAEEAEDWVVERIGDVFGTDNTLESTVSDLFAGANTGVFTIGIVLTVYAASRGFTAVVKALDVAYDHEHRRGFLASLAIGLLLTVLSVVVAGVVIVMLLVGPLFGEGEVLADRLGLGNAWATAWAWLRWPVAALVLVGWAASLFHLAPAHRSPWRWELPGALVSAAWWIVVTLGFNRYLAIASEGANAVFGLLGGALSLLFWLYLMAMGLLVGAEINGILAVRNGVILDHQHPEGSADASAGRADDEADDEADDGAGAVVEGLPRRAYRWVTGGR